MKRYAVRGKALSVGIIGVGTFGTLVARHLSRYFDVRAYDGRAPVDAEGLGVTADTLQGAASCDIVLVATPVSSFETVLSDVGRFCRPGALIMDVGSVKVGPARLMLDILPETVDIVATHPLFGPQSARNGLEGLKITVCPVRCNHLTRLTRFLHEQLGLEVIIATPEEHDREGAIVQGLTHLIAKVLLTMGPLPTRMTTRSFDLLVEAISMVKDDAPEVFEAIETANPFSAEVRQTFFDAARRVSHELETPIAEKTLRAGCAAETSRALPRPQREP